MYTIYVSQQSLFYCYRKNNCFHDIKIINNTLCMYLVLIKQCFFRDFDLPNHAALNIHLTEIYGETRKKFVTKVICPNDSASILQIPNGGLDTTIIPRGICSTDFF